MGFAGQRAGTQAGSKGVLRTGVSVFPSQLVGRHTSCPCRRPSMGFHPLSPGSQKMGEYLVTSVLCLELFLQSSRLTKNSRTLICPLWTSDT